MEQEFEEKKLLYQASQPMQSTTGKAKIILGELADKSGLKSIAPQAQPAFRDIKEGVTSAKNIIEKPEKVK